MSPGGATSALEVEEGEQSVPASGGGPGSGGHDVAKGSGGLSVDSPDEQAEQPPDPALSDLFVAQGHVGRTLVSCDAGRTWTGERSSIPSVQGEDSTGVRCFDDLDCDHEAHPGRGVIATEFGFFATFGWGAPGLVQKSLDGVNWEVVLEGTTFGGLATAQGAVVAGARDARRTLDQGASWSEPVRTIQGYNARRVGHTASHGGRILILGEAGDAAISSDGGASYRTPSSYPGSCGDNVQTRGGIAAVGDTWLIVGGNGVACRSTDGGENWQEASIAQDINSHLVATLEEFVVFASGGKRFSSRDGKDWEQVQTTPSDLNLGAVAAAPDGRMVGVNGGWKNWYEKQVFYRSDDGVTWVEADAFHGGHPIRSIAFGRGQLPEDCQP